jgi:hypothetical protein
MFHGLGLSPITTVATRVSLKAAGLAIRRSGTHAPAAALEVVLTTRRAPLPDLLAPQHNH